MNQFDFDTPVLRRNSDSYKWDSPEVGDSLPLWVADMDFLAAPAIRAALQRRLDHGVFGYTCVPQRYYDAIASWFSRRHGWHGITREHIIYTTGVVPAISAILAALTNQQSAIKNQKSTVLTLTPAYNCFFSSVRNIGCELLDCPLQVQDNHYEVDWQAFEAGCRQADIFLLCNPHNPTGRVWTREELSRMAELCHAHHVFVVSDEIHCEFTFPGVSYTPYALVAQDDYYAVCTAASKAFNVAGLQCANIFVPDEAMRKRIDRAINIHEVCDINPFGMEALIAAYNESEDWLNALQAYLYANYCFLRDTLRVTCPTLRVTEMEGTYLAWVNISALGLPAAELCSALHAEEHVLFNPSEMYSAPSTPAPSASSPAPSLPPASSYIRINMACPRATLAEALHRLAHYVATPSPHQ